MAKTLLDLSTAFDRPLVRIDGVDYQMMERGDLGIVDQMRIWQMYGRVAQIRAKAPDAFADSDKAVIAEALDTVLSVLIPDLPAAVRDRLREEQKLAILQSFTEAAAPTSEALPQVNPPTTESSSQG